MTLAIKSFPFDHFTFFKCYVIIGMCINFVGLIEFFRIQRELKALDKKLKQLDKNSIKK